MLEITIRFNFMANGIALPSKANCEKCAVGEVCHNYCVTSAVWECGYGGKGYFVRVEKEDRRIL
jgi:hypothetical protein